MMLNRYDVTMRSSETVEVERTRWTRKGGNEPYMTQAREEVSFEVVASSMKAAVSKAETHIKTLGTKSAARTFDVTNLRLDGEVVV